MKLLMDGRFRYRGFKRDGCDVTFEMYKSEAGRFLRAEKASDNAEKSAGLDKNRRPVYIIYEKGLAKLLSRYRRRPGIIVGLLLFFAVLRISGMFIWRVEVECPSGVDPLEVKQTLEELGCGTGTFIGACDFYKLSNDFIRQSSDVSWISVNMEGTTAKVELRSQLEGRRITSRDKPSNLIASRDGCVDFYVVCSGTPAVKVSQTVKKGELLVAGMLENKNTGEIRLMRSIGSVYAETLHRITVDVPFENERDVFTGRSETRKTLKIFSNNIKLYITDEILFEKYDKITTEDEIILFGIIRLPVTLTTTVYNEYAVEKATLTPDEAMAKANSEFIDACDAELSGADILSETVEREEYDSGCRITAVVRCLEDIASEVPIYTDNVNNTSDAADAR